MVQQGFLISIALFMVLLLAATTADEPCGGILTGSGVISSPGYPFTYPNNANCKWILNANATGDGISLRFSTFRTEAYYDYVRINDSRTQFSYNGTYQFIPTLTLERQVIITFSSDRSNTDIGFMATFTTVFGNRTCGSIITGAGSIFTPNYPANYSNNTKCLWTLLANSKGTNVRLQFLSFQTEPGYDFVTVYDEKNNRYTYSGSLFPFEMILGSSANVVFSSDSSIEMKGFLASFNSFLASNFSQCTGNGVYWCRSSNKCINSKWRCDGQTDCIYGEDEDWCPTPSTTSTTRTTTLSAESQCWADNRFWCASSRKCISQTWVCDGDKDCGTNGEDEYGCQSSTTASYWQCQGLGKYWCWRSSQCINQIDRCDRFNDCSYGEDEENCPQITSSKSLSVAAISGAVIGSIIGFSVFVVIIVFACRAVSARNTRTTMAARAVQQQNAPPIWSVPAAYPRQYNGGPTSQVYFAAPPPYEAAAQAYTAGWKVCDQLPTSNIPVSNTQSSSQVPGPSA